MRQALKTDRLQSVYRAVAKRYDVQHRLVTGGADQRGRRLLVDAAVSDGDAVLDCGAGTGSTALLAASRAEPGGHITLFDLSRDMLDVARGRIRDAGIEDQCRFDVGDMTALPFEDASFDVTLSTYSLCPLWDPIRGALEMLRVTKPGGRVGVAHSAEPDSALVKWFAEMVESVAWRLPWLSLGCRAVSVLPALRSAGVEVLLDRKIGIALWPFHVFVVTKT